MGDIKSAREIAMEKIAKIGEPTEQERMEWKYLPEGEKLAARYLRQDVQLGPEIARFDKPGQPYVIRGVTDVLLKNITLPANEAAQKTNKLAMEGIKSIKTDKARVEAVLGQMRNIFTHYMGQGEQQRKQSYAALKQDFGAKVEQALRQQMGAQAANMRIDIEKQPQFLEEWRRIKVQLDSQYVQVLDELKQALAALN
jgi:hypothetical protein